MTSPSFSTALTCQPFSILLRPSRQANQSKSEEQGRARLRNYADSIGAISFVCGPLEERGTHRRNLTQCDIGCGEFGPEVARGHAESGDGEEEVHRLSGVDRAGLAGLTVANPFGLE